MKKGGWGEECCYLVTYWWRSGFEVRGRHQATVHSRERRYENGGWKSSKLLSYTIRRSCCSTSGAAVSVELSESVTNL